MINFKEEIDKYKPVLGIDDVEASISADEVRDIMDLLQYIAQQMNVPKE